MARKMSSFRVRLLDDQDAGAEMTVLGTRPEDDTPQTIEDQEASLGELRHTRCMVLKRNKVTVSIVTVCVVAAVALAAYFIQNAAVSQTQKDNESTKRLFDQLAQQSSQNAAVTLSPSSLDAPTAQFLQTTLGMDSFVVDRASVQLVAPDSAVPGRVQVHVKGCPSAFNSTTSHAHIEMHFVDNELHLHMRIFVATVEQSSTPKVDALADGSGIAEPTPVPLTSLAPEIPSAYSQVMVFNVQLDVATHSEVSPISGQPTERGLSINAQNDVSNNTLTPLDYYRNLYEDSVSSLPSQFFNRLVNITGLLRPLLRLNATTPSDMAFNVAAHVALYNVTLFFDLTTMSGYASADMVIHANGIDNLTLSLNGTADLNTKIVNITGVQQGDWTIPGAVSGLKLSNAEATVQFQYGTPAPGVGTAAHVATAGRVGAQINYGDLTAFLGIELPPANALNGKGFAIEAVVDDSFSIASLPAANAKAVPSLSFEKGALVFSSSPGVYTFQAPSPPTASVNVVAGLNLVAVLDLVRSPGLSALSFAPGTITAVISGHISDSGDFLLTADAKNIVVDDNFTFNDTALTVQNHSPYLSLSAQMTVAGNVIGSQSPVVFNVAGAIGDVFSLTGSCVGDWEGHIGSESFNFTQASLALSYNKHATPAFSGQFTTQVGIGSQVLQFSVAYPNGHVGTTQCVTFNLVDVATFSIDQVLHLFFPSAPTDFGVQAVILQDLLNTSLTNLDLFVSPLCGNVTLSAALHCDIFGNANVGMLIDRNCTGANNTEQCGSWKFHAWFSPAPDWRIDSSKLVPATFPHTNILTPIFVLSSGQDTIFIPIVWGNNSLNITYDTVKGLSFQAQLAIDGTDHMELVKVIDPSATVLDLSGSFSTTGWSARAALDPASHINLGPNIVLSKAFVGVGVRNGTGGYISVGGELTAPVRSDVITFDVEGDLGGGKLTLEGDCTDLNTTVSIPIGAFGLKFQSLHVEIGVQYGSSAPAALSGEVSGKVYIGFAALQLSLDVVAGSGTYFNGTAESNPPLTFGNLVDTICGSDKFASLTLPASLSQEIQNIWAFNELSVAFDTSSPPSFNASGSMIAFGVADIRVVFHAYSATLGDGTSQWAFSIALSVGLHVFSAILPGVKVLDTFDFAQVSLAIATHMDIINFPGLAVPYQVDPGFNFFAALTLNGTKALDSIRQMTGISQLTVKAVIEDETQFSVHADLQGDIVILNRFHLLAAGFFINVMHEDVQLGLECDTEIDLTSRPTDHLFFHGDAFVGLQGFGFDVAMTKDWVNPLGVNGVVISRADLSLAIGWDLIPYEVGVAGGLHIDGVGGSAAVWLSEDAEMVYGEIDNIHLSNIVNAMLADIGVTSPPALVDVVTNINLAAAKLYANTAASPLVFFGVSYPPGYRFEVDQLNLWNFIKGSATVAIGPTGLLLNATLAPINLLDGLVVLSGAHSASDPAILYLNLEKDATKSLPAVDIDAGITLFGQHLAVQVLLNSTAVRLFIDVSLLNSLFTFKLDALSMGPASLPTDFAVTAAMNNEVQDYIASKIPQLVDSTRNAIDAKLNAAQADLNSKLNNYTNIQNDLNKLEAEIQAGLDAAEAKFNSAYMDVQHAQSHVDELQDQISNIEQKIRDLPWYLKWEAVGYGAEIAGLEIAYGTATAALDVAKGVLTLAEDALDHIPKINQSEVILKIAEGTAHAAYIASSVTLDAVQDMANGIATVADTLAKWQGEALNIEEIALSAQLSRIVQGDLFSAHLLGKFLGQNVDVTLDLSLQDIDGFVSNIWKELLQLFCHFSSSTTTTRALAAAVY